MRFIAILGTAALVAFAGSSTLGGRADVAAIAYRTWSNYGGAPDQSKFFAGTGITKQNVARLRVAFTYPQGDSAASAFSPIIVDTVMYVLAKGSSLVALDARTGREIWIHANLRGIGRRGINYWQSADGKDRRLLFTMGTTLQAIDANTGLIIPSFGDSGAVDLRQGLDRDPASIARVASGTPGAVFGNLIILGSSPGEDYFSPPGHIRAYDVVTGARRWTFHTIPHPGEFGHDTWPPEAYKYVGGANVWGEFSLDTARGIVYAPIGSPTYDYYGADRIGANLFGTSLVALNARTGERVWHFQFVHHDLWDYDPTAAPQLITVRKDGRTVDAVAQATKQGFLFVFNRETGEPIFPIEERPVPASDVPGEQAWPTQPFPTKPVPFARQIMTPDDITPHFLTDAERETWVKRVTTARKGLYLPPSLTQETVAVPGGVGGANWGNTAANPSRGIVYVLNQDFPSFYRLEQPVPRGATATAANASRGENVYDATCIGCHGPEGSGGIGPAIKGIKDRASFADFRFVVSNGGSQMPPLSHLSVDEIRAIYDYLGGSNPSFAFFGAANQTPPRPPSGPVVASGGAPQRPVQRTAPMNAYPASVPATPFYRTDYGLGHPYIMRPPWSTLTAYDLNTGDVMWRVPIGHDRDAEREGGRNTGVPRGTQRNGMVVTATGLVFSTAKDGRVYAFDAENGRELWSGQLPSGTEGLPAMYEIAGKQYLVVNATTPVTWGRASKESGIGSQEPRGVGGYVVFTLP